MKKKEIIHQIYLSLYLANLLFFSFLSICCPSQSLIFFQTLQKKVIFGGPTQYTKKFLHSGIVSTVFCLIPEKTKREIIIYLEHCLFLVSHLFVSPQPHISSKKKFGNILSKQNILEKKKSFIIFGFMLQNVGPLCIITQALA